MANSNDAKKEVQKEKSLDTFKHKYSFLVQQLKSSTKSAKTRISEKINRKSNKSSLSVTNPHDQQSQNTKTKKNTNPPKHDESPINSNAKQQQNDENEPVNDEKDELKETLNENNNTKKDDVWQCTECTFIQSANNKYCELCSNYNDKRIGSENEQKTDILAMKEQHQFDAKLAMLLQMEEAKRAKNKKPSIFESVGDKLLKVMGVESNTLEVYNVLFVWQRLPIRELTENDINTLHKTEETKTCSICMNEWKIGDKTRQLPCFHFFHQKCIDEWFTIQNGKGNNASCPLDRKIIKDTVNFT